MPTRAGSRRERERERRRRRRRQRLVGGGVAAVALVAGVVIVLVLLAARHPHKVAGGKTGRTQVTLLFQLRGADGASAGSVLLAHDPTARRGTAVLVPSQVIAEVPGAGSQPFGQALALPAGIWPAKRWLT